MIKTRHLWIYRLQIPSLLLITTVSAIETGRPFTMNISSRSWAIDLIPIVMCSPMYLVDWVQISRSCDAYFLFGSFKKDCIHHEIRQTSGNNMTENGHFFAMHISSRSQDIDLILIVMCSPISLVDSVQILRSCDKYFLVGSFKKDRIHHQFVTDPGATWQKMTTIFQREYLCS